MTEQGQVICNGVRIPYILQRKAVKNINLRVQDDGSVHISAPLGIDTASVESILQQKALFLLRARRRLQQQHMLAQPPKQYVGGELFRILGHSCPLQVRPGQPTRVVWQKECLLLVAAADVPFTKRAKLVQDALRQVAQRVFARAAQQAEALLQDEAVPKMVHLRLRHMRSRWGSCIPAKATVTLSFRLLELPWPCVQAVVLHEYVHFLHPDHSPAFYATLERYMPDYRNRALLLKSPEYASTWNA